MYMFSVFVGGFYSIFLLPLHILLWCTGYLVQDKVKSPKGRTVFLGVLVVGLLLCEMLCQWVLTGYDKLVPAIIMLIIWDLVFGYFAKPVCRLLRKLFQALINWITQEENTKKAD